MDIKVVFIDKVVQAGIAALHFIGIDGFTVVQNFCKKGFRQRFIVRP